MKLVLADNTRFISVNDEFDLVKNFYSPAEYLLISQDVKEQLLKAPERLPRDLLDIFANHHVLIEAGTQIIPRFSASDELEIWLHVTNNCNLDCSYCYVKKDNTRMEWQTFKDIAAFIFMRMQVRGLRKLKVKYSGGEALLVFPQLQRMHEYLVSLCKQHQIAFSSTVLSNGTIYSQEISDYLRQNNIDLMISLDGYKEFHNAQRYFKNLAGSYEIAWQNLLKFKKDGHDPMVSITVTSKSAKGLPVLIKDLLKHKLHFNFNFVRETDSYKFDDAQLNSNQAELLQGLAEAFQEIENNLPAWSLVNSLSDRVMLGFMRNYCCGAGRNYLFIDHKGRVAFCQMTSGFPYIQIRAGGEPELLKPKKKFANPHISKKKDCAACDYKYLCAGSCPLQALSAKGSAYKSSYYCAVYHRIIPQILRLEGLRLLEHPEETVVLSK